MSRVGKKPIEIPDGVTVNLIDRIVNVKGPLERGIQMSQVSASTV